MPRTCADLTERDSTRSHTSDKSAGPDTLPRPAGRGVSSGPVPYRACLLDAAKMSCRRVRYGTFCEYCALPCRMRWTRIAEPQRRSAGAAACHRRAEGAFVHPGRGASFLKDRAWARCGARDTATNNRTVAIKLLPPPAPGQRTPVVGGVPVGTSGCQVCWIAAPRPPPDVSAGTRIRPLLPLVRRAAVGPLTGPQTEFEVLGCSCGVAADAVLSWVADHVPPCRFPDGARVCRRRG